MSDGLNRQPRADPPESALPAGMAGVASMPARPVRWIVNPAGITDTSISGPVMLQQPPRWTHDFDPDSGDSRAHLPAVVPIFASPPAAVTPPAGSSDNTLATTEFVALAQAQTVEDAVAKARIGVTDGFPAAPGEIGEFLSITVPQPGIELVTATIAVVATLELPPGDWDVQAMGGFSISGLPLPASIDFVSALGTTPTFPGWPNAGGTNATCAPPSAIGNINLPVFQRWLLNAPQTILLLAYAAFPTARVFAYGYLSARRRR